MRPARCNGVSIEPPSLNIPLERNKRWGLVLIAACVVATAAAALVSVSFAKVFAASCVVGLPALWLFFLPPRIVARRSGRPGFMRVLTYALLFGYLAIAKGLLIPAVLSVIDRSAP